MASPKNLAQDVALQPFAWPGGYPRFAITDDGAAICPKCCGSESEAIQASTKGDGWHVVASEINWENPQLFCDHCGERIESAYAKD